MKSRDRNLLILVILLVTCFVALFLLISNKNSKQSVLSPIILPIRGLFSGNGGFFGGNRGSSSNTTVVVDGGSSSSSSSSSNSSSGSGSSGGSSGSGSGPVISGPTLPVPGPVTIPAGP